MYLSNCKSINKNKHVAFTRGQMCKQDPRGCIPSPSLISEVATIPCLCQGGLVENTGLTWDWWGRQKIINPLRSAPSAWSKHKPFSLPWIRSTRAFTCKSPRILHRFDVSTRSSLFLCSSMVLNLEGFWRCQFSGGSSATTDQKERFSVTGWGAGSLTSTGTNQLHSSVSVSSQGQLVSLEYRCHKRAGSSVACKHDPSFPPNPHEWQQREKRKAVCVAE